jgi:hypothetical protein
VVDWTDSRDDRMNVLSTPSRPVYLRVCLTVGAAESALLLMSVKYALCSSMSCGHGLDLAAVSYMYLSDCGKNRAALWAA